MSWLVLGRGIPRLSLGLSVGLLSLVSLATCEDPTVTGPGGNKNPDMGEVVPGIGGLKEITLNPPMLTLTLDSDTMPKSQKFTATGRFDDGHTEDITDRVTWSVSPSKLGLFKEISLFESGRLGGEGTAYARSGSLTGSAKLSLRVSRTVVEPDAAGADESKFKGTPDASSPGIVYPYDQVMMPPNLGALEVHFTKGNQAHNLFELTFQNRSTDIRIYTGCKTQGVVGQGCIYSLTRGLWDLIAYSNNGADPVVLTIRGTDGKTVGISKATNLRYSGEDVKGGIYYWNAAEGGQADISRIDLEKGTVERFYTTQQSPQDHNRQKECVGCHALSHDGKKINLILGGGHVSDLVQLDVDKRTANLTKIDTTPGKSGVQRQYSNFQTYNNDGTSFVSALRGKLRLVNGQSGADLIPTINTGGNATHPDWSRGGTLLAFTRYSDVPPNPNTIPPGDGDNHEVFITKGGISLARWTGAAFDAPKVLIPERAGQNNYYPSVAPNDQVVAFNRLPSCNINTNNPQGNNDCTAYDNPKAQIYLAYVNGGDAVPLTNINKRGPNDTRDTLTNSWPKWCPFRQTPSPGQVLMWVTFSSKRNYGVRLPNNTDRPQLWMAAVTVSGEPTAGDPSSPPFWIPNQDIRTHNHIAQWTEQVIPIIQ